LHDTKLKEQKKQQRDLAKQIEQL